ncbi:MAG: plasmid pRiA4b ORF-3 family protein [Bacteroidia bacterium]|nr:plasmid pRiA4b ORF-3 family protein [Bacteroidia bacterium]
MSQSKICQLHITLQYSDPPIWRRILVRGDMTLRQLHEALQIVMGWQNQHLYQFRAGEDFYADAAAPDAFGVVEASTVRVHDLLRQTSDRITYEYDFGDGWLHDIVLENIQDPDPDILYPRCSDGALACPPEDVGGIPGFYAFLKAINDPTHEEHGFFREWIGDNFDEAFFDPDTVNRDLSRYSFD